MTELGAFNGRSRVGGWLVAALQATLPVVALYSPMAIVPLLTVTALLCLATGWRGIRPPSYGQVAILALPLAWSALTALWSINAAASLAKAAELLGMVVAWLALHQVVGGFDQNERVRASRALVLGLAVTTIALLVHVAFALWGNGPQGTDALRRFNRAAAVMAVLLPAALLTLRSLPQGRWLMVLASVPVGLLLYLDKHTLQLALAVAVVTGLAAWRSGRLVARALGLMVAASALAAPVLVAQLPPAERIWDEWRWLPSSLHHRLTVWEFTAERIAERPVLGWGLNVARQIPGGERDVEFERPLPSGRTEPVQWRLMPLHPHNAPLQWWLELGGMGAALMAALGVYVVNAAAQRRGRAAQAAALASVAAVIVVSLASFGAWQSWWLCTVAAAALALRLAEPPPQ